MSLNKKIVILILILSLTLNGVFLLPFKKAEAAVSITVICMSGAGLIVGVGALGPCSSAALDTALATKKTAFDITKWTWEKFADYLSKQLWPALRDMVAKRIMDYIVNETVKWIQGGGKPKFIGNWEGFIKDVGDIAFDSVMKETGLAKLCTPFGLNIMIGLLPVEDFSQRITCTLDKVVSNIQNFYVDFSVGGWRGYNMLWQPENNYYGVAINIADEVMNRVSKKSEAAKSEGLAGSGFMGDKICKAGSGQDKKLGQEAAASKDVDFCYELQQGCLSGSDKSEAAKRECGVQLSSCINEEINSSAKSKGMNADRSGEYCDPKDLVDANPGSLVGKAVGEAITSDSKWAANIQSWVSALVNAVINRVIKEGVLKMQEITSDKKDSYWPSEYQTVLSKELERDKQQMYGEINRFVDEWKYSFNAKDRSLFYASSTLAVSQQLQQIQLTRTPLPLACEPVVTGQDIQVIRNEINRLTAETQVLQVKINAADSVTKQISDANFLDEFQRIAASTAYGNFINQYGTTAQIEAIVSGSDRQAADTDAQTKQTELDNIQTRLNACQAAINPPPAP
ncbi:MAG: hypothetical protein AAB698_01350 [Patescibacteria group bacterium]